MNSAISSIIGFDWAKVPPDPYVSPKSISLSHFLDRPRPHPAILFNRRCTSCYGDRMDPDEEYRGDCDPLPFQLLYVSRTIFSEVLSTFYSENKFSVVRTDPGGLSCLQDFRPVIIARLTSLSIRLNVSDCQTMRVCQQTSHRMCCHPGICMERGHDKLLGTKSSGPENSPIVKWTKLCKYMASHIVPNQLKLCVICDVADIETAKEVVDPLSSVPILRGLAIRLGNDPKDLCLYDLAKRTVYEKTNHSEATQSSPFRFGDLPQEIRFQILECTELVTPFDIAWAPYRSSCGLSVFEFRIFKRWYSNTYLPVDEHFSGCCRECSDAKEGCCCWRQRAAYSSSCTCWKMPMPLLSVCRQMREDATTVFFSKNHFVVLPAEDKSPRKRKQLEILQFLDRLPPTALTHIRSLTWIVPTVADGFFEQDSTSYRDWLDVVDISRREMNLPQLNLTLDFLRARRSFEADLDDQADALAGYRILTTCNRAHRTRTAMTACAAAQLLTESLLPLGPFKNLRIHLSCHWGAYPLTFSYSEDGEEVAEKERNLEKQIMGDEYNAILQGKHARRHGWNGYFCYGKCGECPEPEPRKIFELMGSNIT
ncbi:uncharacterized protein PAC_18517 [Phialocephala subalpina]|uniref:Uncharacterized protein n=1 Tax=Phialocephala subalpina TaxID=576137 RepID=A0A1L7XUB4_9HELO|nr:uncharacterized protein PAC_18517 [Phialocephala subalpina]